jgi:DNA-binding MarR family transcriptional regulator
MAAPDPSFGWSIGLLFRNWQQGASAALSGLPHGARGFQILATVAGAEPPTQAALAAHLGIDRTVLTYVLDDLVDAGLLERKIDGADRRVRRLVITAAGRKLLRRLQAKVAEAETILLSGLSSDDQMLFRSLLERVAGQLHQRDPGHDACSVVADILDDAPATPASGRTRGRTVRAGRERASS